MDVNYTDRNVLPMGALSKYAVDLDIGDKNDFELQMNIQNHCMEYGSIWYVDHTEFGGIVDDIKIDTQKGLVYYMGRSWRGILQKKIIEPDPGQDFYTVSGDANDVLWEIMQRLGLQDFFSVPSMAANIQIQGYQFDRYIDAYSGIMKMLGKVGAKPVLQMEEMKIRLEAVQALDLSSKYEYSDDYGMQIILDDNRGGINHMLCLGQGDLKERIVIHLYVNAAGEIVKRQH